MKVRDMCSFECFVVLNFTCFIYVCLTDFSAFSKQMQLFLTSLSSGLQSGGDNSPGQPPGIHIRHGHPIKYLN